MSTVSFDDMATLAAESPIQTPPFHRRRKSWARRVERICCRTLSYFPLTFVYGLTTWAVYVETQVSFIDGSGWIAYSKAALGILLYGLANASYTTAVFTPPGSPLDPRTGSLGHKKDGGYEGLPTYESEEGPAIPTSIHAVTAKSSGKQRYCKKCRTVKPDRTHHCSTCKQCVLKMDHHCPWLATCVGLHNYKPFVLFLVYTSLFCWVCFGVSATWVWSELMTEIPESEGWRIVNTILLAVLGGIIGLVLSGFTGWHLHLCVSGSTTIESLEKTRYLNPLRKSLEHRPQQRRGVVDQGSTVEEAETEAEEEQQSLTDQLKDIHANALPGVLRAEEGEDRIPNSSFPVSRAPWHASGSPAQNSLRRSYASLEAQREQERYEAYLDEQDSEKLPNAFDLSWKRNLLHIFGERPLFWALPVCNTTGDGWQWEVSSKWLTARDDLSRQRAQQQRQNTQWDAHNPASLQSSRASSLRWTPGQGFVDPRSIPPPARSNGRANGSVGVQMQPLDRRKGSGADDAGSNATSSSDEDARHSSRSTGTADWNDVPDELLPLGTNGKAIGSRSQSTGRTKGD